MFEILNNKSSKELLNMLETSKNEEVIELIHVIMDIRLEEENMTLKEFTEITFN